jgi:putative phage-type endonuclease
VNLEKFNLLYQPVSLGKFDPLDPKWHELRKNGIGASESAAILEVEGAFGTPLKVWASKMDDYEREEGDEAFEERMRIAHRMEPIILAELKSDTSWMIEMDGTTYRHPEFPYLTATPDAWARMPEGWGLVELKNVSEWAADEWGEEAPLKYQVQLQHQMLVTGARRGVLAAVLGGNRFVRSPIIERNDDFIKRLFEKLTDFWKLVCDGDMPNISGPDLDLLKKMHGDDAVATELPYEAGEWDEMLAKAKEQIKHWEKVKAEQEAQIWNALDNATIGALPGGGAFKVITATRDPYSVKGTTYKYLRKVKA